jgi:hypothetical protein
VWQLCTSPDVDVESSEMMDEIDDLLLNLLDDDDGEL